VAVTRPKKRNEVVAVGAAAALATQTRPVARHGSNTYAASLATASATPQGSQTSVRVTRWRPVRAEAD
jgi:hypothetical protein